MKRSVPAHLHLTPQKVKGNLTADQFRLYKLIYERFLASQMAPAVYDTVTVSVQSGRFGWKANGRTLRFPGFLKLYEEGRDAKVAGEEQGNDKDELLPPVEPLQKLICEKIDPSQHFTKPSAPFSEAKLGQRVGETRNWPAEYVCQHHFRVENAGVCGGGE